MQLWVLLYSAEINGAETFGALVLCTQDDSADLPLLDCPGATGYA